MKRLSLLFAFAICLPSCGGDATESPTGASGAGGSGAGGGAGAGGAGDTTPPSGVASPLGDLGLHEAVVVSFDEAMDPATLALGGSLAPLGDGGVWTTTTFTNDTLTVSPNSSWESGTQTLTVAAADLAGNGSGSIDESYAIRLHFSTFQAASVAIGQPDFTSAASNQGGAVGAATLGESWGSLGYDRASDTLFVPDGGNHRILAFAGIPAGNGAAASFVLGQSGFDMTAIGVSATGMDYPEDLRVHGDRLIVDDWANNRIAIYAPLPAAGPGTASVVVGQPGKDSKDQACAADGLSGPDASFITPGGKLVVSDSRNSRVLVWNSLPTSDGTPADLVLGQATFTTCAENDDDQDGAPDAPSARTLSSPAGAWSDDVKLVVLDDINNRALVWNSFPTQNFQPADLVLGQGDFAHVAANDADQDGVDDGTPNASTLNDPYIGVWSNGLQLLVSDASNHRVLVWEAFPTQSFQPADLVIGQSDFAHAQENDDDQDGVPDATPSARTIGYGTGLAVFGDKLFVTDGNTHRAAIFESN